jgi:hypothetical protein
MGLDRDLPPLRLIVMPDAAITLVSLALAAISRKVRF